MNNDTIVILKQEKIQIESEIKRYTDKLKSLNDELVAINIVLSRNIPSTNNKSTIDNTSVSNDDEQKVSKHTYTKSEQRIIDALHAIGGKGKVTDMFEYLKTIYPNEDKGRLHSSVRQHASSLGKKGLIGADKQLGNKGSIYYLLPVNKEND